MFKTFDPTKGKNPKKEVRTARINEPHRAEGLSRINERTLGAGVDILEDDDDLGDSPFDMAPDMNK